MKKILFTLIVMTTCGLTSHAQWVAQPTIITAGYFVQFIDAVDTSVVWGVVADPTQANAVQEFVKTTDGGQLWIDGAITNAAGLAPSCIFGLNADTAWVSMYNITPNGPGAILRTDDGGGTWNVQPTALFNAAGNFPDFVHFWDANNGICLGDPTAGYYEIYTTIDGGVNWVRTPSANIPAPQGATEYGLTDLFASNGDSTIWFGTTTGRIYKTSDRGLNWTVATTPYAGVFIGQIAFRDANNGLASNGSLGAAPDLIRTTDGGTTWTLVATNTVNIGVKQGLCYVPGTDSTYFLTNHFAGIGGSAFSPDDGNNWVSADLLTHSDIEFVNDSTGWTGSEESGNMYKWSTPVVVAANDVSSESVDVNGNTGILTQNPQATFKNNGLSAQTFNVTMAITGGYSSTKTITGLTFNSTQQITFDPWTPAAQGVYTITIYTQLATDVNLLNDTLTKNVTVYPEFENYGWTSMPAIPVAAFGHGSAFWLNGNTTTSPGQLFAIGGINASTGLPDNNQFDTPSLLWNVASPMPTGKYHFSAQKAGNKIYCTGGYFDIFVPDGSMYIYDVSSGTWTTGAAMPVPVGDFAAGVYNDSLIYYINGYDGTFDENIVQIYNTFTNSWSVGTSSPGSATEGSRGAIVGNNIIFTCGAASGITIADTWQGTIDPADATQITWTSLPPYPGGTEFRLAAGVVFQELRPLVIFTGGSPSGSGAEKVNDCWGYDFTQNQWLIGKAKTTPVNNIVDLVGLVYNDSLWMASVAGYDGTNFLAVNEWLNLGASPPLNVGINQNNVVSNDLLMLYPNPAGNEITIKLKDNTDVVSLTITDVSGRIVKTETISKGQATVKLNIKMLDSGIYLLQISGADNNAKGYTKFVKE